MKKPILEPLSTIFDHFVSDTISPKTFGPAMHKPTWTPKPKLYIRKNQYANSKKSSQYQIILELKLLQILVENMLLISMLKWIRGNSLLFKIRTHVRVNILKSTYVAIFKSH